MKLSYAALPAYLVLLAALARVGKPVKPKPDGWMARHDLAANHQLDTADLKGPDLRYRRARLTPLAQLAGKHLLVAKLKGDTVEAKDLAVAPSFVPGEWGSKVAIYRLKEESYVAGAVRQGSWVVLCLTRAAADLTKPMSTQCSRASFRVEAIHHPVGSADSAWLALRIPRCHSTEVGEYLARASHFLMIDPGRKAHR
jgi:hypothetical protein